MVVPVVHMKPPLAGVRDLTQLMYIDAAVKDAEAAQFSLNKIVELLRRSQRDDAARANGTAYADAAEEASLIFVEQARLLASFLRIIGKLAEERLR